MKYTIRLTPAQLRQKASDIDRNAGIVQKEVDAIEQLVNHLRSTFLGETASAFFKEFNSALKDMEKWDDVVRTFSTEIRDAANKLEAADRKHH